MKVYLILCFVVMSFFCYPIIVRQTDLMVYTDYYRLVYLLWRIL